MPLPILEGAFLLTGLLTGGMDRLGENVRGGGFGGADHVGVDAEGDGRVGVAQASRDDVDRDAGEAGRKQYSDHAEYLSRSGQPEGYSLGLVITGAG
jgi:hypothetical protein